VKTVNFIAFSDAEGAITSILAQKTQLSGEFTYKEHYITQNFRKFTCK
jgi:hypothetical protein